MKLRDNLPTQTLLLMFVLVVGCLLLGYCTTHAQKRLSLSTGFGRSAAITDAKFRRATFNISLIANYRLTKRMSLTGAVIENFGFGMPSLRTGIVYRIL